jgi:ribosome-associated protein
MGKVRVTPRIAIPDSEFEERFVLSSGPGGQNVNKVASAVQLRFDAARSPSLADEVRSRLLKLAGRRVTKEGVIVLEGSRFRSQERNRTDVRERLFALIREAATAPKPRKKTKPGRAANEGRLQRKKIRAAIKRLRRPPPDE